MGKKGNIDQLTNLMSRALRHRIGSIVNESEIYASKYAKDAENVMSEVEKAANRYSWNNDDKKKIKEKLRKKLKKELIEKDFLDNRKFEIMDGEMHKALIDLDLA